MLSFTRTLTLALFTMLLMANAGSAATILVNFDSDVVVNPLNGFASVDSPDITFSDTIGENLVIVNAPVITGGSNALAVFFDDASALRIDFSFVASDVQLLFGNDNPAFLGAGDVFELVAFLGAAPVGVPVTVVPNFNSIVDDPIGFSGMLFDAVELRYTGAGTIEIIDNLMVTMAVTIIPEPSAALLFGAGALLLRASVGSRPRSPRRAGGR
jgi:hypothetical protein